MLIEDKVCFRMGKLESFELRFTVGYELRKASVVAKSRHRIQVVFKHSRDRSNHRQSKQQVREFLGSKSRGGVSGARRQDVRDDVEVCIVLTCRHRRKKNVPVPMMHRR